jgi:hypothetical protein
LPKVRIFKRDGTPTPFFYWSGGRQDDPTRLPAYKNGSHGVERMKGVFFNAVTNRMTKS